MAIHITVIQDTIVYVIQDHLGIDRFSDSFRVGGNQEVKRPKGLQRR